MLVDANLLLYAVDERSPQHERAAEWWEAALNGDRRVGLPWQTIGAFLRVSTQPRVTERPLSPKLAWSIVASWLEAEPTWVPPATERTAAVLATLIEQFSPTANLMPDAQLAALALEHGVEVCSADTDFARFTNLRWYNPLA